MLMNVIRHYCLRLTHQIDKKPPPVYIVYNIDTLVMNQATKQLLETARIVGKQAEFEALAFDAKFLLNSQGIVNREGTTSQNLAPLVREMELCLERIRQRLETIMSFAPESDQSAFRLKFLALEPSAFQELLTLCSDLRWYKNWTIDHRPGKSPHG